MALAPSERAGGDTEAKPPDPPSATTPSQRQPPEAQRCACPSPAPRARPRLEARRGGGASWKTGSSHGRLGELLQEHLLLDFYSTSVPGSIAPSLHPVDLWITPASTAPHYNLNFVRNMLNFCLTAPPSRLQVTRVRSNIFKVRVSGRNVANAIVVLGRLCMGSSVLLAHPSMATAVAAVRRLPGGQGDAVPPGAVTVHPPPDLPAVRGQEQLVQRLARGKRGLNAKGCQGQGFRLNAPAVTPLCRSVPPRPTVDACLANSGGSQLPATRGAAALNAPQQPAAPGSYLQALLTPAQPRQTLARRPAPIVSTTGCFRCLASDHLVRECRDPVRCRNCRDCDHRL